MSVIVESNFLTLLLTFIIAVRETAEDFKKALKNKYDFDLFSLQNIFIEYQFVYTYIFYVLFFPFVELILKQKKRIKWTQMKSFGKY